MFSKGLFRSIQSRLIVSFLMSALIVIAIVSLFNFWIRQQLVAEADARQMATANNVAEQIEQFNQRQIQALEMGARLPQLERFLDASPEERANPEIRAEILTMLGSMQSAEWNQFYTLSFAILDANGINILDTTSTNIERDESTLPYFQQPMVTGVRLTSSVFYLAERTGAYYYFLVPIRRSLAPNPVIGLLRAEVSISAIQDLLLSMAREEAYSEFDMMLFDSQMVRLVDTRHRDEVFRSIQDYSLREIDLLIDAELVPNMPVSRLLQPVSPLAEALGQLNESAVFESPVSSHDSEEQRLAAIRLSEPTWYLLLGKPAEEFYLPIQRQTQGLFLLSIFLMLAAFAISLLISRNVTRPIAKLTEVAKAVAAGNLDVQADVSSQDEIGTLALTFNQMTRELNDIKSNLEQLVAERTQSLKESNQSLTRAMQDRERLEEQNIRMALEAERTRILSEFIQDASHEFKTPLSVINVKLHLLKRLGEAKLRPHVEEIERQSHHIEALVNTMVLMAKLDSMTQLALSPIYVDDFLRSVYESENVRFESHGISVAMELDAHGASIDINAEMMHEAMKRILDNARSFTPKGGRVTIMSHSETLFVEIQIRDTGSGMSPEVLNRAFERFYRMDEAHTTRGFGLGLPIAKRIIELSYGTIEIESELATGAFVIIRLPRSAREPQRFGRERVSS